MQTRARSGCHRFFGSLDRGNDERISLENVRRGARIMYEIVLDVVQ